MSEYIKEIMKIPLLSDEETNELLILKDNIEVRNKLIRHNLRIVVRIAYKYIKTIHLPIEDLISMGSIGLIKAIEHFDVNSNNKLSTYAYAAVENIYNSYIYHDKQKRKLTEEQFAFEISLNEPVYHNDENATLESIISDDTSIETTTIEEEQKKLKQEMVREIMSVLTEEEQEILTLRYGLYGNKIHSIESIAKAKSLTSTRIRQKEKKAFIKLRLLNKDKAYQFD